MYTHTPVRVEWKGKVEPKKKENLTESEPCQFSHIRSWEGRKL